MLRPLATRARPASQTTWTPCGCSIISRAMATPPPRLDRADVRVDGQINNLDAVMLRNWVMGNTPLIPVG